MFLFGWFLEIVPKRCDVSFQASRRRQSAPVKKRSNKSMIHVLLGPANGKPLRILDTTFEQLALSTLSTITNRMPSILGKM